MPDDTSKPDLALNGRRRDRSRRQLDVQSFGGAAILLWTMRSEWDENKAARNLTTHGVSFDEARTVFDDPLFLDYYDPDHSEDEHRYVIVGESNEGQLLMVSYTERGDTLRIISARRTNARERRFYEEYPTRRP